MSRTLPRPGHRARQVVTKAAYAGGTGLGLAIAAGGVVLGEAKLARRTIGEPDEHAPDPSGSYGRPRRGVKPLHLAILGDSSAAGLGVEDAAQTPGALLAGMLARDLKRRVQLDVQAVTGARSKDLDIQVQRALRHPLDVAVIMVGANDVTHRVPPADAGRALRRSIAKLQENGVLVVVGTCPDLGSVAPLLQPLRKIARIKSREMAQEQTVVVVEQGAVAVSLGNLLGEEFSRNPHLWSPDRFHPSEAGYARVVTALLPSVLEVLGVEAPGMRIVGDTVQDVDVAAAVAASNPGVEVETIEGGEGAAAAGGRLARLVRRVPLVGGDRGAPAVRTEEDLTVETLPAEG